jgi:hypothetical protein
LSALHCRQRTGWAVEDETETDKGRSTAPILPSSGELQRQIAADLAAELATPLAVIEGQIALLLAQPGISPVALREQLLRLREHSQRIRHTVHNLQAVAAPQPPRRVLVRLRSLVDEAAVAVGRRLDRTAVTVKLQPANVRVYADPDQLRQALTNLLAAAANRSPGGGRIQIGAHMDEGWVWLRIEDEGAPPLSQLAAFQAVAAGGTLDPRAGLSPGIAARLIQRNGGHLSLEPVAPVGVAAVLRLPLRAPSWRLLIIDPDGVLGVTVEAKLQHRSHRCWVTPTALQALHQLDQHRCDVVLIASSVPDSEVGVLEAGLRLRWPKLARRVVRVGPGAVLEPGFTQEALLDVLRSVIAG